MITAVDTNVLMDLLLEDPSFQPESERLLRKASNEGSLVICEVVYGEVAGFFPDRSALDAFLKETGVHLKHSSAEVLWKAGHLWRRFHMDRPVKPILPRRLLADFLIGAHALLQSDRLLTRDKGFYRAAFSGLRLLTP